MHDVVWLLRHGDTEWTDGERHTGLADVPLSDAGRMQARRAGELLAPHTFDHVLVSPQRRALETCALAGFARKVRVCADLVEWDYGNLEGLTDEQTRATRPGWDQFRDGAPGGETPLDVEARIERMMGMLNELSGSRLLVGHGKSLRALAARWLGFGTSAARLLALDPAAISMLERTSDGPMLRLWNCSPSLLALPAGNGSVS
jgi:probable phosphoglycerate mutase